MKNVTGDTMIAWQSGAYIGSNRAMVRVTVQPLRMVHLPVDNSAGTTSNGIDATTAFGSHNGKEEYSSAVFSQNELPVELPNVKSLRWSRNLNQDAATLTLELYNTDPLPLGETPESAGDFDRIGYYTVDRGDTSKTANRWGYSTNAWQGRLVPDQTLRTYEGYGFDASVTPENDPHMYPSGVWLIDEVDFTANGLITIQARDLVRVLIDQICFPPVVPLAQYPLDYMFHQTVPDPPSPLVGAGDSWVKLNYETDSGVPYYGANHTLYGHAPSDAFDTNAQSYWLSIGNGAPNQGYSYEFVQGTLGVAKKIVGLQFQVWGGPYQCYVSVKSAGAWVGNQTIPYDPTNAISAPNGANIPYVQSFSVGYEQNVKIALAYTNVTSIRLTFTDLYNSHVGPFVYRAGVRSVLVNTGIATTLVSQGTHITGNYDDFSDIIKKLLAYGGFYWPSDVMATNTLTDRTVVYNPAPSDDPVLGKGRIWGDIEGTGTHAATELTVDIWDKKPLMDGISYIRDIVAFVFFVDETGGAVWRSPNIWQIGNYVGDLAWNAGFQAGLNNLLTIDESITLMDISVALSSRDVREWVFVANSFGQFGATSAGWNPYPTGLQRVSGWTDQNFQRTDEAQIMADLIMIRQMFQYRTDKIVIPGMPAFQIDDQVRVIERVTNEGYVHYINGIDSSFDMESGEWTYTLATQWLGTNPDGLWFADFQKNLSQVTLDYLTAIGKVGSQ